MPNAELKIISQPKNLYVTTQGATIKKETGAIAVYYGEEKIAFAPIDTLSLLVIFGNVQVTTQALGYLLNENVDVAFMTQNGHFKGKLVAADSKNSIIRRNQHAKFSKPEIALQLGKKIVQAKYHNGLDLLNDYHRNENNAYQMMNRSELNANLLKIEQAENIEQLLGYEGNAARIYFSEFAKCFTNELKFEKRAYFPSPDPINAMLSFGYSFLAREMQAILEANGLDPYIGFYHQVSYGRASLSLDLIEVFRHSFVDRLVLKLANRQMLTSENFEKGDDGGFYLKKESLAIYVKAYEEASNHENMLYHQVEQVSIRKVMWDTVNHLKRYLKEEELEFEPWRAV